MVAIPKGNEWVIFKFGFVGQGSALDPPKGLLKKSLRNPQNFSKKYW